MASNWFYRREGQIILLGPFSAKKLKELAATGQIRPTDSVKREGAERMVSAQRVKGLFTPRTA